MKYECLPREEEFSWTKWIKAKIWWTKLIYPFLNRIIVLQFKKKMSFKFNDLFIYSILYQV